MKIIVICLLLLSASFAGVARLDTLPSNFQLYPRDQSDSGSVVIKGVVLETGHDSLIVLVKRNGALLLSVKVPLTYTGDSVSFRYVYRIRAELAEYSFEMKVDDVSILSVNNVVSGDAFVVSGQSNAVAFPGGWAQEYVRSYVNSRWVGDTGAAGAWEQELGALIAARTGIPVAIINGAESATGITEQLCNPTNHRDAGTMYGRLLNRVINAGLQNKVRAMFYYQGENNTNRLSGSVGYAGYFNTLRSAWHEDYPALEKIYVCQINMWNPLYEVSEAPSLIRDIQRKFQHDYSDIATIATVGTPGYDGGHYTLIGYNMLGRSMFPLIERDLYYKAGIDTANVSSPDIVHASYTTAARDRISLRFDQPVYWTESDGKGHYMKDYFALDGVYKVVDSGWNSEDGRTIELKLKTSSTAAAITYLHNTNAYHNESGIFIEPVLRNSRKIAALTFYQFPISLDTATVNSIAFTLMADTVEQYDTVSVSLSGAVPGVVFTSLDPFVAAVSIDGLVTGKNIGVARIVASKQNYKDTLVLHVISGTAICKGLSFVSDKKQVLIDSLFSPEVVAVFEKGGRRFSAIVDSLCIWHYNSGYFAKSNGKIKGLIAGMEIPLVASLSGFTDTLYVDMYMYPSIVKRINLQTQYEPIKKIDGWI
ncbi:MAG: hypothetical protein JNL74_10195, partial [Fibrobacteres bacterium]|nr:hypothetical protein [Fibrobacterota bacterium]